MIGEGTDNFSYFCLNAKSVRLEQKQENSWLEALYKGEEQAYKALFDHYFFALSSFAAKYLEEREASEDVVQDILYELWENRRRFQSIISLKSYLYQMVRNRCLNVLKHRRVKARYFAEQDIREESDYFLNQILEEEVYLLLKEAINELPEPTRRVYDLTLLGHDNQQIADLLGLTLDAVKARKKRGKQILQDKLKNLYSLFAGLLF